MANNHEHLIPDDEWQDIRNEACDAEIEIYVIRKDKVAVLCQRPLPVHSSYVRNLVAALLDLPKLSIKKITLNVDGSQWP